MIHVSFDTDMPTSCATCPFLIHCDECESWENFCALLHKGNGYDYRSFEARELTPTDRRREDCPLKDGDVRPHGKWTRLDENESVWRCSVCDEVHCCKADFCSNCGAKMEVHDDT